MGGDYFLVVFDCDGTLVDSAAGIVSCMQGAFNHVGRAAPASDAIRQTVGLPPLASVAALCPEAGRAEQDSIVARYKELYVALRESALHDEPLYPGTVAALDRLMAAGAVLGVATGKGRRGLASTLARHGITDRFVTLKTADDAPGKPNPDMLLHCMAEAGVARDRAVMVGDTSFDMAMAKAARVPPIGVTWGYHSVEVLRDAGAVAIAHDYDAIPNLVWDILKRGEG